MYQMFMKGGPVMWPLLACSVLSLTVILERALDALRRRRLARPEAIARMLSLTAGGDCEAAAALGGACEDPAARVLAAGLANRGQGLEEGMLMASQEEIGRMKRGLGVLDTVITLAPLLGILGTVLGIIKSFDLLGLSGIAAPQAVVGGIAEALITTAAGLTIAVLTLVPFNYFVVRVQARALYLEQLATQLVLAHRKSREGHHAD